MQNAIKEVNKRDYIIMGGGGFNYGHIYSGHLYRILEVRFKSVYI